MAKLALLLVTSLLGLLLLEVAVRVMTPRHFFLDPHSEDYWKLRFAEFVARYEIDDDAKLSLVADPRLGWRMQPDYLSTGDRHISHDSRGLRNTGRTPEQMPPGSRPLVILGDSFTYGLGVSDEDTFAARLEERLPGTDVVNLGVNGFGLDQQYLMWQDEGQRLAPRVVLLGYFILDFHRSAIAFREFAKPLFVLDDGALRLTGIPVPDFDTLAADPPVVPSPTLRLGEVIPGLLDRVRRRFGPPDPAMFGSKVELNAALLAALNASVQDSGARLAMIVIPHPLYRQEPQMGLIEAAMIDAAENEKIPLLNLTDVLEAADSEDEPLYAANGHWTPRAHALATDHILEFMSSEALVP